MKDEQKSKCHTIIHIAATECAAIGSGLAQLPGSDALFIVPIQINMIRKLANVFDINLQETAVKSLLASSLATVIGRGMSQVLIGWIPFLGNVVNASTAASVTEAIGWFIAKDFASGYIEGRGIYDTKILDQ